MLAIIGGMNAIAAHNEAQTAVSLSQAAVAAQQSTQQQTSQTAADQQMAKIWAQLVQVPQNQGNLTKPATPASTSTQGGARPAPSPPAAAPSPEPLNANYSSSARYLSDGNGGLIYEVDVTNDGQVELSCSTTVTGLIWGNQYGGMTGSGGGLQTSYSDTEESAVYPGHTEVAEQYRNVVANSATYSIHCVPYQ